MNMKGFSRTLLVSFLMFLIFLNQNKVNSSQTSLKETSSQPIPYFKEYITHEPIIINSNDDFISYGFEGNGTTEQPYIIANYSIVATAEYGIKICCVDKKYIIQNCYINLDFVSTTYAIYLQDSPIDCSVLNNTCEDNIFGLYLNHCSKMNISGNMLKGNIKGLYAFNSDLLTVSYNNCTKNNQCGFEFYDCIWIAITDNMIYKNLQTGIKFNTVQASLILQNLFIENYAYAVYLTSNTNDIEIYLNSFINNSLPYNSQAYDSGENIWYDEIGLVGNLWSDLGFSCYYALDGAAGSLDMYPLNKDGDCTFSTSFSSTTIPTTLAFGGVIVIFALLLVGFSMYLKSIKRNRS